MAVAEEQMAKRQSVRVPHHSMILEMQARESERLEEFEEGVVLLSIVSS